MNLPLRTSLCLVMLSLAACGDSNPTLPVGANLQLVTTGNIKFLTQAIEPSVGMEALFTGRLTVDDNGCIRLDSPDDATVIWPKGYRLEVVSGVAFVRDGAGDVAGTLDGEFSLGGGEVESLHSGMGFTEADESFAAVHCPGRYWIVNAG